jgi:hypothetical protein
MIADSQSRVETPVEFRQGNCARTSTGMQTEDGKNHPLSLQLLVKHTVFLDSRLEVTVETMLKNLQAKLEEAEEKLHRLEADNRWLSASRVDYRLRWLDECRVLDMVRMNADCDYCNKGYPSISQAEITSPSPSPRRNYG